MNNKPLDGWTVPTSKSGWPWIDDSKCLCYGAPDKRLLPSITIVTPSYNQGQFLEETIRSVLLQRYPNLEYFIMDGGSTDSSREIIQRYASDLTYWRSQIDNGQSAAISEGFRMSTGEILGWVNSDDLLLPNCLLEVGKYFTQHPDLDCVVGGTIVVDETTRPVRNRLGLPRIVRGERETLTKLLTRPGHSFYQPASFWRRQTYMDVGGLDINLRFAMDYDLYLRLASRKPFGHLDQLLACLRLHPQSKSTQLQSVRQSECAIILQRYMSRHSVIVNTIYRKYLALANIARNLPVRVGVLLGLVRLTDIGNQSYE